MKALLKLCIVSAIVALPGFAYAQAGPAPKPASSMNCPMMGDMNTMQNNMGTMMTDMSGMMNSTTDPAMKARMQTIHDQMAAMKANMQNMHAGMMGGGMMGGGMMRGSQNTGTTPPATPDDHAAHHTNP